MDNTIERNAHRIAQIKRRLKAELNIFAADIKPALPSWDNK